MTLHPLAGHAAPPAMLVDLARLEQLYHEGVPDTENPAQRVSFGTSGHRGTPFDGSFTEAHILAISQAIAEYREERGITGPLYLGKDTHAVSGPAERTALLPPASKAFARSWIRPVTSVSAGPPSGGLYLKPPSAGGLCDGVTTIPSASPADRPAL